MAGLEDDVRGQRGFPIFLRGTKSKYIWLEPVDGVSENAAELEQDQPAGTEASSRRLKIFLFPPTFSWNGVQARCYRQSALPVTVSSQCYHERGH